MELYEITIWKWQKELHRGTYQFRNVQEASQFELGMFEGFRLAGKKPTGLACKRVDEEPNTGKRMMCSNGMKPTV